MALSGSFYNYFRSGYRIRVTWDATQNTKNNTSHVTVRTYLDADYSIYSSNSKSGSTSVDGSSNSWSYGSGFNGSGTYHLSTDSFTVNHNVDGNKQIDISSSVTLNVSLSGSNYGTVGASENNITLNKIPRKSELSSDADFNLSDEFIALRVDSDSSEFQHLARIDVAGQRIANVYSIGTSENYYFSDSELKTIYSLLSNKRTANTKVTIETHYNGDVLGSDSKTGKVTAPRESYPDSSFSHYVYTDESMDVNLNRSYSGYTHTVKFEVGSFTKTFTGVKSGVTFNPTSAEDIEMAKQFPNSDIKAGNIYVDTFFQGEKVGYTANQFMYYEIRNAEPDFNADIQYKDTNSNTSSITGDNQYIIQNSSNIRVTIPVSDRATANKGADMVEYICTLDGVQKKASYSSSNDINFDFNSVSTSSNAQVEVKAVDSRGFSSSSIKDLKVIPYNPPVMNTSAERVNNFEDDTNISVSGRYSPLNVGGVKKNNISPLRYRYKKKGNSTWSSWNNLSFSTSSDTFTSKTSQARLDNTNAWDIQFNIQDELNSIKTEVTVSEGKPLLYVDTELESLGVGRFPSNKNSLEVEGKTISKGGLHADGGLYVHGQPADFTGSVNMNSLSISNNLDVNSDMNVSGDLDVNSSINVLGNLDVGGKIKPIVSDEPSMMNGFENYRTGGGAFKLWYYKHANGLVTVQGLIRGGTGSEGAVAFTFPSGMRPKNNLMFYGKGYGDHTIRIDVLSTGEVKIHDINSSWVTMNSIQFMADN